jgi:hypothetical protein
MGNIKEAYDCLGISKPYHSLLRQRLEKIIGQDPRLLGGRWHMGSVDRDYAVPILTQQKRGEIFAAPFSPELRNSSWTDRMTTALMTIAVNAKGNASQWAKRHTLGPTEIDMDLGLLTTAPSPSSAGQLVPSSSFIALNDCQFVIRGYARDFPVDTTFSASALMQSADTTITAQQFITFLEGERHFNPQTHILKIHANGARSEIYVHSERIWQSCLCINIDRQESIIKLSVHDRRK